MPLMTAAALCFWVQRVFPIVVFCTFFCWWKSEQDKNSHVVTSEKTIHFSYNTLETSLGTVVERPRILPVTFVQPPFQGPIFSSGEETLGTRLTFVELLRQHWECVVTSLRHVAKQPAGPVNSRRRLDSEHYHGNGVVIITKRNSKQNSFPTRVAEHFFSCSDVDEHFLSLLFIVSFIMVRMPLNSEFTVRPQDFLLRCRPENE